MTLGPSPQGEHLCLSPLVIARQTQLLSCSQCCDQLCQASLARLCLGLLTVLSPHTAAVTSGLPTLLGLRPGLSLWILIGLEAGPGHQAHSVLAPVTANTSLLHSRPGARLSTR